jgi:ABC-type glycerol-3-phosphate transport system substrate-binding protein
MVYSLRLMAVASLLALFLATSAWSAPIVLKLGTWATNLASGTGLMKQQIVDAFNQSQDRIRVEIEPIANYNEAILVRFAVGEGPDLIFFRPTDDVALRDHLVDLQPYFNHSGMKRDEFIPGLIDSAVMLGKMAHIPMHVYSAMWYYRPSLFEMAGIPSPVELAQNGQWNWDSALSSARKLTQDTNVDGTIDVYGMDIRTLHSFPVFNEMMARQKGGSSVSPDGTRYTGDQPPFVEAMQWYADLHLVHNVIGGSFTGRTAAMYSYSAAARGTLRHLENFDWDLAPYPNFLDGKPFIQLAGNGFAINSASKEIDAAWEFIQFAIGREGQLVYARSRADMPGRLSALRDKAYVDEPGVEHVAFTMNTTLPNYAIVKPKYIPDGNAIYKLVYAQTEKAYKGEATARAAFAEIASAVQQILNELQGKIIVE